MSFYNWIQEKLFDNYEEWRLKSPDYNRNGFNIVGIDNTLKAMHDGFFMYVELYPPHAIDGCTAMKARVGKTQDAVDLFLDIDGKTYRMADVSYPDAVKMMRAFVKKRRVPDCSLCVEVAYLEIDQMRSTFTELATLLLGDAKQAKSFMTKAKLHSMEELEDSWWNLINIPIQTKFTIQITKEEWNTIVSQHELYKDWCPTQEAHKNCLNWIKDTYSIDLNDRKDKGQNQTEESTCNGQSQSQRQAFHNLRNSIKDCLP